MHCKLFDVVKGQRLDPAAIGLSLSTMAEQAIKTSFSPPLPSRQTRFCARPSSQPQLCGWYQ